MAQPAARGARGRALLRSAGRELRQTAKWAEAELRALARARTAALSLRCARRLRWTGVRLVWRRLENKPAERSTDDRPHGLCADGVLVFQVPCKRLPSRMQEWRALLLARVQVWLKSRA